MIRKKFSSFFHASTRELYPTRWSKALQSAVLLFSDQQSLIGISVLVSGFSQLSCSLDIYHWQLTFDLAWFSSITHLTTLTCLRHYFRERPTLRIWRITCMAITAVLLATSLVPTGYSGSYEDPSVPAWCLYQLGIVHPGLDSVGDRVSLEYNALYIALTLSLLVLSYSSRVLLLMPTTTNAIYDWVRLRPRKKVHSWLLLLRDRAAQSSSTFSNISWAILHRLIRSTWCLLGAMADLWSSLLWEVAFSG